MDRVQGQGPYPTHEQASGSDGKRTTRAGPLRKARVPGNPGTQGFALG